MGNYCRITRALYVTHSQNTCCKYERGAALEKLFPLTVGVILLAALLMWRSKCVVLLTEQGCNAVLVPKS